MTPSEVHKLLESIAKDVRKNAAATKLKEHRARLQPTVDALKTSVGELESCEPDSFAPGEVIERFETRLAEEKGALKRAEKGLADLEKRIDAREREELENLLSAQVSAFRAAVEAFRKDAVDLYRGPLTQPLRDFLARGAALTMTGEDLRRDLKAAGLDCDTLPSLTAELVPGRPETQLRALWDDDKGVRLPSLYHQHSSAFDLWPRDARVGDGELLAEPAPRYVPTPSVPDGPREWVTGPGADCHRVQGGAS